MCTCHSILECCVTFSGVKLSIRSFVLFTEGGGGGGGGGKHPQCCTGRKKPSAFRVKIISGTKHSSLIYLDFGNSLFN